VVFYDFVGGLELSYSGIRLTSSLYRGTTVFGHPAALYASATVSDHTLGVVAVFGAKQPILPYVDCVLHTLTRSSIRPTVRLVGLVPRSSVSLLLGFKCDA